MWSIAYKIGIIIASILFLLSFYLFSRLTIDDAFITWSYGRNLVDYGVWNYNPSNIDVTAAYTNPLFAFLSIIPAMTNINVVIFFKTLSIFTIIVFIIYGYKKFRKDLFKPLMFLAIPATIIHAFSGLETFLFVFLMGLLLIYLDEENVKYSIGISLILFFVRPESWLLTILVPAYFYYVIKIEKRINDKSFFNNPISIFLLLSIPLLLYIFIVNKLYFGYLLPNSFYVKVDGNFDHRIFFQGLFFLVVSIIPIFYNRVKISIFMLLMFSSMLAVYSMSSNLQMNFAARFIYQIYGPICVYLIYLSSKTDIIEDSSSGKILNKFKIKRSIFVNSAICIATFFFLYVSFHGPISLRSLITYYPRLLVSHGELGDLIREAPEKYNVLGFSMGDAGLGPYNSRKNNLDFVGLGSAYVTHHGIDKNILKKYKISLIVFYANTKSIDYSFFNQKYLYNYALSHNFHYLCNIYYTKNYILSIYSKKDLPGIFNVCKKSFILNKTTDKKMLRKEISIPPWDFWKT